MHHTLAHSLEQMPFARHCGIHFLELDPQCVVCQMPLGDNLCNLHGSCDAGAQAALAEFAAACLCAAADLPPILSCMQMQHLRAASGSALICRAVAQHAGRRLAAIACTICDDQGRTVATAVCTYRSHFSMSARS